ncbi:MAG: hemerythrin domain-containing protein [Betaproteobacteria bacterium]
MPTTNRSNNRADSTARNIILTMLKDDHKRAKKAFRDFEKLDPHEDAEECRALVEQTCGELEVHAALEEELFYPAARNYLSEEDLIDEAEVEHASLKSLIQQLKNMEPEDEKYAATFTVLGEYVKHHVREEENEMFPQLGRAKMDWKGLCDEMNSRREELMQEFLPEQAAGASEKEELEMEEDTEMVSTTGSEAASRQQSQKQRGSRRSA